MFDQGRAVVPGATVTATNQATNQIRTSITGTDGRFNIPTLVPGTYTVKVELQGFETTTQTALAVGVGQELTLNLTLRLAGVAETVNVTAQSPLVEATSSKIGTNVTTSEIDGLPSANRSQFALMQTIPGMVPTLQPGSFEGGQFSANGQATTNNLFVNGNHSLSFRWTRERILTVNDSIENDLAIPDAARHENDSGDQVFSFSWTSVLNNRTTIGQLHGADRDRRSADRAARVPIHVLRSVLSRVSRSACP